MSDFLDLVYRLTAKRAELGLGRPKIPGGSAKRALCGPDVDVFS